MRALSKSGVLFALTAISIAYSALGQSTFRFQRYDTRDGLAFDICTDIVQDSLGYIWIAHPDGLSRFDGYEFKQYKCVPGNSLRSKLNIQITGIARFPLGGIYVHGEKNELLKHNFKSDGFDAIDTGLKSVQVQQIDFEPGQRRLWVAAFTGLYFVDLDAGTNEHYINQHRDADVQLLQNDINGIKDLGQTVLLATVRGLWLFDKTTKTFIRPRMNPADTAWAYNASFRSLIVKNKSIWLSYWRGSKVIGNTGYHEALPDPSNIYAGFAKIDTSFNVQIRFSNPGGLDLFPYDFDDEDIFYASSAGRLLRFDPKDSSIVFSQNDPSDLNSLSSGAITSIKVDREKNVWVSTLKGVNVLRTAGLQFQNVSLGGGTGGGMVFEKGGEEYLIAGRSSDLREILIAQFKGNSPLTFKAIDLSIEAYGLSSFFQGRNHLWVSAPGHGVLGLSSNPVEITPREKTFISLKVIPGNTNSIGHRLVTWLYEDNAGDLWIANKKAGLDWVSGTLAYGSEGSVKHFLHSDDDTTSLEGNLIYHLYPENDTSLWVVSSTGVDLLHWNKMQRKGRFEHIVSKREAPNVIQKTKDGSLFLGTTNGLYQIIRKNTHYVLDANPLWSKSSISGIQEDSKGRLWLYGSNGLVCFDRETKNAVLFDKTDGIEHVNAVNSGGIHRSKDGFLFTFDSEGFTVFDPSEFGRSQLETFPIITRLYINNQQYLGRHEAAQQDSYSVQNDISVLKELTIDHKHNNFTLEFSVMQMAAPEKNIYLHKLEGYEEDWIESDHKNRTATYTNLPSGTYTFRVKASNHHGVWSDKERTLKVIILPPPWKTSWAYTGYILIVVGLLFMARRMIVQRERLKGSLKLAKVEQEKEHFELEKAKEVDRVKTSFFTNISHEFRTPLTLIKGPVETLLDRFKDDPDVVQRLKLVQRNSDVLLRLINQLLDLAKLEAGTMKIEKSNSDINSFIRAIAGSFESLARHKNVTLSVEIPSDRNPVVFDKDKLETILINLINNAIKFTPSGGKVHIQAACSNNSLTITVRDTGIGIPAEHQQKVFERFHQVSEAHKEIGTGIGLSLVKELIQLLEGRITVSSEPGKGTNFTVMIPVEAGTRTSETVEESVSQLSISEGHSNNQFHAQPPHNGAPERPHVLVVEDNDDLRAFIIDSLGQEFYFLEADNGRKGLEVATTEIPDLIISDVMMPEMDGITMAGKIKTDHRSSHIPLILLTAKSTEDSKLMGLKSGADDYLTKPFNREELLLKVRNSVSRQIKLREKLRAEVMGSPPTVEVLSEDERFLVNVKEKILERLSDEQLSVESLAEDIGISRVHLYRKVSGLTGLSVNELIRKLRLQRAAQLIGQHWGPVSQVAYEVGYSNLSYFSKVFKEEFGMLPSEYFVKAN